jgi:hypothetical protein
MPPSRPSNCGKVGTEANGALKLKLDVSVETIIRRAVKLFIGDV